MRIMMYNRRSSGMDTPPFYPTERNNNLYARGAVDDKGSLDGSEGAGVADESARSKLPINVKVIFEARKKSAANRLPHMSQGEGEVEADFALVCDTERLRRICRLYASAARIGLHGN